MSPVIAPTTVANPTSAAPTLGKFFTAQTQARLSGGFHNPKKTMRDPGSLGMTCSSQCLAFHRSHQPMPAPELLFKAVSIADRGMTSPKRKEVAHG